MITIRPFTDEDVSFAVAQTAREGWATGPHRFRTCLEHDPGGGFVAWDANQRVGIVTSTRYGAGGWVGNLIVVPDRRSRGIGRMLMNRALRRLQDEGTTTVRLDADPPGMPLYRSLGFEHEWESRRYRITGRPMPPDRLVEPLPADRLTMVARLDARRFGDDRRRLLEAMHRHSVKAFMIRSDGGVAGYLLMDETSLGLRVGPCVSDRLSTARELLAAAVGAANGRTVTLGVPAPNRGACTLLEQLGFEPTVSSWRMLRGERTAVGELHTIFAIAGGAVG